MVEMVVSGGISEILENSTDCLWGVRAREGQRIIKRLKLDQLKEQIFHLPRWGRQEEEQVLVFDTQRRDGSASWEPKVKSRA